MCLYFMGRTTSSFCNSNPVEAKSLLSVAVDGLVLPSSIRAMTDCAVPARSASSRCERLARERASRNRYAGFRLVILYDSKKAIKRQISGSSVYRHFCLKEYRTAEQGIPNDEIITW